jgi:hypothetical protein
MKLDHNNQSPLLPISKEQDPLPPLSPTYNNPTIDDSFIPPSTLSPNQINSILKKVTYHLETHGRITPELLKLLDHDTSSSKHSTSSTPSNHPTLMSSDKMSRTAVMTTHFTVQQLSRYFGFRSLKNWDVLHDVCQPNFSFVRTSDNVLEIGQVANIKKARSNKTPVDRPPQYLEVVHCDIGFRDVKSVGNGALYCLILVDRATRYSWIYPLKTLHHNARKTTFQQWLIDCGGCPSRLYTDFDPKILDGTTAIFLRGKNIILWGAPSGRQNQNGLVERAWETTTNMARAFVMDMQMPRSFWYWALRQSIQVMNCFPCTVTGISTTPHELVYGIKPDLRILFRLFSTGYLKKKQRWCTPS